MRLDRKIISEQSTGKLAVLEKIIRYLTLWMWGGVVYYCIELLYRGHSHLSMYILGGICFLAVAGINNWFSWEMPIWLQCIIGGIVITVLELVTGLIVNVWLDLGIWCYADTWGSAFMGQISIPFTLAWMGLSFIAILLDDFLRWKIFGEEKPHYFSGFAKG